MILSRQLLRNQFRMKWLNVLPCLQSLSARLNAAKKAEQALRDKMEADMKAAGILAKQFPELDNQRKSLMALEAQLGGLKNTVDEQKHLVDARLRQAAEIENATAEKLRLIEQDVANAEARLLALDSAKTPEEKPRVAKVIPPKSLTEYSEMKCTLQFPFQLQELVGKASTMKKSQQELKRKFESDLAVAEIESADFPELQSLANRLNEVGSRIDTLKDEASKRAETSSVQMRRLAELADETAKKLKEREAQVRELEEKLAKLDALKSPEERASRAEVSGEMLTVLPRFSCH